MSIATSLIIGIIVTIAGAIITVWTTKKPKITIPIFIAILVVLTVFLFKYSSIDSKLFASFSSGAVANENGANGESVSTTGESALVKEPAFDASEIKEEPKFEKEDNGSREVAQLIIVNEQYTGNLQDRYDVDYYKVEISTYSSIQLEFGFDNPEDHPYLKVELLSDTEEITQVKLNNNGIKHYSDKARVEPGIYYIKVYYESSSYPSSDYLLTVHVVDESMGNYEREDNDKLEAAQLIIVNEQYTGNLQDRYDVDYYKVEISTYSSIQLEFGFDNPKDHPYLKVELLSDTEEITQVKLNNNGIKHYSDKARVELGIYYIKVYYESSSYPSSDYSILVGNS